MESAEPFELLLERVTSVRRFKRGTREAPHKPLVLLHALSAAAAGQWWISFNAAEAALSPVIQRDWNATARIEQPFVRLVNDGFWTLSRPMAELLTPSGAISVAALRRWDCAAGFDDATYGALRTRPARVQWAARVILFEIASSDVQASIIASLNLPL